MNRYEIVLRKVLEILPPSDPDDLPEILSPNGYWLLTTPQLLLLSQYFLLRGWFYTVCSSHKIQWFYLTTGEEPWPSFQDLQLELVSMLLVKPEVHGGFLGIPYLNCLLLFLHDNAGFYRIPVYERSRSYEAIYNYANLIPYYKYCLAKQDGSVELQEYMRHALSLARVEGNSISISNGTHASYTGPIFWKN
jgi:hypothetical protein